jgi:hypothetical protein
VIPQLEKIAKDKSQSSYSRGDAMALIATVSDSTALLEGLNSLGDDKDAADASFL